MINVCFAGVTGWTAAPILGAIAQSEDLTVTSGVSRRAAGQPLRDATGFGFEGRVFSSVAEAVDVAPTDVVVDYTSATAVKENAEAAVRAGRHLVIGSSGLTAEDYAELDHRARHAGIGIVAAGNFSILAAVLRRAAAMAAEQVSQWEIIDYASDEKPDVPSGTSRELAETLSAVRRPSVTVPLSELYGPVEARGAGVGGTRIHSVRLPSYVVTTDIVFAAPGERLTFRHDPGLSPDPYAAGTLLAIRAVSSRIGLTRGLDALLFPDLGDHRDGVSRSVE